MSLLELDTAVFSVKDSFGLDRFKNGFVVEAFKGHGIGDVRNLDYNISMDFDTFPSDKNSRTNFGGGIELLMNDKKVDSHGPTSDIDIEDLNKAVMDVYGEQL